MDDRFARNSRPFSGRTESGMAGGATAVRCEQRVATIPTCEPSSKTCCEPTDQPGGFLDVPQPKHRPTARPAHHRTSRHQIGPYKLLQQIGEGGMGVVYMAEQTEPVAAAGGAQDHQAGHGHAAGDRPVRGRAAGPGHDGPPEHRQGARCGHDRQSAGPTSSWSWSRASRSPSTATSSI